MNSTCSISGMWRCLVTPYAFMPSAISVYSNACFALRPAAHVAVKNTAVAPYSWNHVTDPLTMTGKQQSIGAA